MGDLSPEPIFYEQPLSERVRVFLRLEYLFARAAGQLQEPSRDVWSSRAMLEIIIDVMALVSRSDLKKEIIHELARHKTTLGMLSHNPNVDTEKLDEVLSLVSGLASKLREKDNAPGHELRYVDLITSIRQRSSIPAGTCDFDLPAYHYWLESPLSPRVQDLQTWSGAFNLLNDAVALCLRLVRESGSRSLQTAAGGFFQMNLETSTPCQLIRVALSKNADCYPEISAGKHRFTIRFMRPGLASARPSQTDEDINFDLSCCGI